MAIGSPDHEDKLIQGSTNKQTNILIRGSTEGAPAHIKYTLIQDELLTKKNNLIHDSAKPLKQYYDLKQHLPI